MDDSPAPNEPAPPSDPAHDETEDTSSAERTPAASFQAKKPSFFKRTGNHVFGPETRLRKAVRPAVRLMALAVIFFLLGMLLMYFRFYTPAQQQLVLANQQSATQSADLQQTQSDTQAANQKAQEADQRAQQAQTLASQAQEKLGTEMLRNQVLQAIIDISSAQLAVEQKNKTVAAQSVNQAEADLKDVLPQLKTMDSKQVSNIQAVFTLIKNDLPGDPKVAQQDLERMRTELELAEKNLQLAKPGAWNCTCQASQ